MKRFLGTGSSPAKKPRAALQPNSGLVDCFVCGKSVPAATFEAFHLEACLAVGGDEKAGPGKEVLAVAAVEEDTPSEPAPPQTPGGNALASLVYSDKPLVSLKPPEGLFVVEDFVTPEQEAAIVAVAKASGLKSQSWNGVREHVNFGVHADLRGHVVVPEGPIPAVFRPLMERIPKLLHSFGLMEACPINHVTVLRYLKHKGHSIGAHMDDRHFSGAYIINCSLMADATMTFAFPGGGPALKTHRIPLRRRSLQIMSGPARWTWSHRVDNKDLPDAPRFSVTFRSSGAR